MKKSRFEKIGIQKENGSEYRLYVDRKTGKFYKINAETVLEVDNDEIKVMKLVDLLNTDLSLDARLKKSEKNLKKWEYRLVAFLLALSLLDMVEENRHRKQDEEYQEYLDSEEELVDKIDYLNTIMDKNESINGLLKEDILKYLTVYFKNNKYTSTFKIVTTNLKTKDFSSYDKVNVDFLKELLSFKNGGFLAKQLYDEVNNIEPDAIQAKIRDYLLFYPLNWMYALDGYDVVIYTGGERVILNLDVLNANSEEILSEVDAAICKAFEENFRIDYHDVDFEARLFSEEFDFLIKNTDQKYYYKIEDGTANDITDNVYFKKLTDFVYQNGEVIDYNNESDRILLYLYVESLRVGPVRHVFREPATFIYDSLRFADASFDLEEFLTNEKEISFLWNVVRYDDLKKFLEFKEFDYSMLQVMADIAYVDEALPLVQELNRCFKIEVEAGNMSEEQYLSFYQKVIEILMANNPNGYLKFIEVMDSDKSLDGYKFELIKTYQA